jgi:MFS family permease
MNSSNLKGYIPHLIAIICLLFVAVIYLSPIMQGKVLPQSDTMQSLGMQHEMLTYQQKGEPLPLWTNSMFGGMPTYQLQHRSDYVLPKYTNKALLLGMNYTDTLALLFIGFLGCYILLAVLKVDWRIALLCALFYGLSTLNIDLVKAGHSGKLVTMALTMPTLAGIILIFRGRYGLGAAMTAIFFGGQVFANHVQITFYFVLLLGLFLIVMFIDALQKGEVANFIKAKLIIGAALLIGTLTNTSRLWTTYEYAAETIRGKSDLTKKETREGLSKDYAFDWSHSISETFSIVAANYKGGSSGEYFVMDPNSHCNSVLRKVPQQQQQQFARLTSHYWGEQPFVGAPVYYGAVVCFLFLLGLFLVRRPIKWWLLVATILIFFISWGEHFPTFNYFLFDHVPLFNKFRAVNMMMGFGQMTFAIMAALALSDLLSPNIDNKLKKRALMLAGGATLGLLLALYVSAGSVNYGIPQGVPEQFASALRADRSELLQNSVLRSLVLVGLAFATLWAYFRFNLPNVVALAVVGVLAIGDLWSVDRQYLNDKDFVSKNEVQQQIAPTPADNQIMRDNSYHRVLDLSRGNPFSNAITSYFHKSVGGYHAAKMMIYQEMVERYLTPNPIAYINILSMLNCKYILQQQGEQIVPINNPEALGNAWFVQQIKYADNADDELDSLGGLAPRSVVVVQKKYADYLKGLNTPSGTGEIKLTSYHPEKMVYQSNSDSEQLAVFSEIYYKPEKGWKVLIDGKESTPFIKANYVLRALRIPAGQHTIEMRFEPASFYTGVKINMIASLLILLLLGYGIYQVVRSKNASDETVNAAANTLDLFARPEAVTASVQPSNELKPTESAKKTRGK